MRRACRIRVLYRSQHHHKTGLCMSSEQNKNCPETALQLCCHCCRSLLTLPAGRTDSGL